MKKIIADTRTTRQKTNIPVIACQVISKAFTIVWILK